MPPDTTSSGDAANPPDSEGWHTLKRFLPYLWPKGNPSLRIRIVGAIVFVLAAKAVMLALPFALSLIHI